jgi:hypothetical protein
MRSHPTVSSTAITPRRAGVLPENYYCGRYASQKQSDLAQLLQLGGRWNMRLLPYGLTGLTAALVTFG